jgi:uncharacterized RDD family membrane protein YckC
VFCPHCATLLPPGAQYCPACGKPVPVPDAPASAFLQPNAPKLDAPQASEPPPVRPWVRYWARLIDLFVFALPAGAVMGAIWPHLIEQADGANDLMLGLLILLAWAFVEPLCLSVFGTTPGKALLKVRLSGPGGRRLTYIEALGRSLRLWWRGLGAGVPFVSLITLAVAYRRLKRQGHTSWDAEGGCEVRHEPIGLGRVLLALGLLFLFLMLVAAAG